MEIICKDTREYFATSSFSANQMSDTVGSSSSDDDISMSISNLKKLLAERKKSVKSTVTTTNCTPAPELDSNNGNISHNQASRPDGGTSDSKRPTV